jgi:hypothetical protein
LVGVANMGAPGAAEFTPWDAVEARSAPVGPLGKWVMMPLFLASCLILNKRSLIARGVGRASSVAATSQICEI